MFVSEFAALSAALSWAVATLIYGRFSHHFDSLQMVVIKGVFALFMMIVVLLVTQQALWLQDYKLLLIFSGVIGIAIGDSCYFAALRRVGANLTLLLESLAPPLTGLLTVVALGEPLSGMAWLGILITVFGVSVVVYSRHANKTANMSGILFGVAASVCQATGVILTYTALTSDAISPMQGAFWRLLSGTMAIVLILIIIRPKAITGIIHSSFWLEKKSASLLIAAIFVGTFLALWLQQLAIKTGNPAIAQTLLASSPIFILFLSRWHDDVINRQHVIGTLIAITGIFLLFYQG